MKKDLKFSFILTQLKIKLESLPVKKGIIGFVFLYWNLGTVVEGHDIPDVLKEFLREITFFISSRVFTYSILLEKSDKAFIKITINRRIVSIY